MMNGINRTYTQSGYRPLELVNMRGRPNDCSASDVHLRMPGIPDYASDAWLSLLSTGLSGECHPGERCHQFKKKVGAIHVWDGWN